MSVKRAKEHKRKGNKDAKRHRDKQKEIVKKNMKKIISESSIITEKKGKKVKIPIRGIVIPDFKPGKRSDGEGQGQGKGQGKSIGAGQGKGKKGDVIGEKPGEGKEPGKPGQKPGEDYIESEVEIAEIIEMMLDDLGLPNLEDKKNNAQMESIEGYKISGIRKSGPNVLLEKKRTSRRGIGRFYAFLATLEQETGEDEITCYNALRESDGNLGMALDLLESGDVEIKAEEVEPFPILMAEDRRYMNVKEDVTYHSNAVIFAMMDVSASMTTDKKYLARSMLFWINEFLKKMYENVEIRFIIHHAKAKQVTEENFFRTRESGGTKCVEAYKLAKSLIESQYPTSEWNVYVFHFSDGEDWDPTSTISEAKKMIEEMKINMLGYGEIRLNGRPFSSSLRKGFEDNLSVETITRDDLKLIVGDRFLGMVIRDKDHILPAIQEFLKKERWKK